MRLARRPARARSGRDTPPCTAVLSDLHVSDIEPVDPRCPSWRRHKHADLVTDARLARFLDHLRALARGQRVELVLNGDVFDFDVIKAVPESPPWPVSWLERARGLHAEEPKSAWKMQRIVDHHPVLFGELARWVREGHDLVFVIGNHDLELHWPAVQDVLRAAIAPAHPEALRVCEFFVISHHDTLITHGNQYDAYCVVHDPVHPFIDLNGRTRLRLPFGDQAAKLMINGMGLFNPHVDDSLRRPIGEYARFYLQDVTRHHPTIAWTWLWSALVTLWVSLAEGFRPALRDPARMATREALIARRARSSSKVVRALQAVAVHPAVFDPVKVARELWLDRAFLLAALIFASVQVFSALTLVSGAGTTGGLLAFVVLLVPFVRYARSCRSSIGEAEREIRARVETLAAIAHVRRVVMGHTHRARRESVGDTEYINTGHWSPAFADVACTKRLGRNGFAWIVPGPTGARIAELRVFGEVTSVPHADAVPAPEPGLAAVAVSAA